MRQLCWPLLAVVAVRFVLNPEILKYPLGVTPIFNWILWGYGLSIAALVVGLRFLRPTADDRLVRAAAATVALLAFGLVGLFVGPVVLAVTYTQLAAWVSEGATEREGSSAAT